MGMRVDSSGDSLVWRALAFFPKKLGKLFNRVIQWIHMENKVKADPAGLPKDGTSIHSRAVTPLPACDVKRKMVPSAGASKPTPPKKDKRPVGNGLNRHVDTHDLLNQSPMAAAKAAKAAKAAPLDDKVSEYLKTHQLDISPDALKRIKYALPHAWGTHDFCEKLHTFKLMNELGAGLSTQDFINAYQQNMIKYYMVEAAIYPRGIAPEDALKDAGNRIRKQLHPAPQQPSQYKPAGNQVTVPSPAKAPVAATPKYKSRVPTEADMLQQIGIDPQSPAGTYYLQHLEHWDDVAMDSLQALHKAMSRSTMSLTPQECAALVNGGAVDIAKLNSMRDVALREHKEMAAVLYSTLTRPAAQAQVIRHDPVPPSKPVKKKSTEARVTPRPEPKKSNKAVVKPQPKEVNASAATSTPVRVQKTEASNNRLFEQAKQLRDKDGKPLVSSQKDFESLMAPIPKGAHTTQDLLRFLTYFRNMQCHQAEVNVVFVNGMFSALVGGGHLGEDPTNKVLKSDDPDVMAYYESRADIADEVRREALKDLFKVACVVDNFDPQVTGNEQLQELNIQPAGTGLYNYKNMCFMNSAIQAVTPLWEDSGVLDEVRAGIPVGVLFNMLDRLTPTPKKWEFPGPKGSSQDARDEWMNAEGNRRKQRLMARARELAGHRDISTIPDNPPGLMNFVRSYQKVSQSFVQLTNSLTGRAGNTAPPINAQKEFLQSLLDYAIEMNIGAVKEILLPEKPGGGYEEPVPGHKLILAQISQQDPQNFLSVLAEVFGVEHRRDCTMLDANRKQLVYKDEVKDTQVAIHHSRRPMVSIPAVGQQTLQGCINAYQKRGVVHDYKWPPERMHGTGLTEAQYDESQVLGQDGFAAVDGIPPKQMVIQARVYKLDDYGRQEYLRQEGQALLQNFQRVVEVPFYPENGGEPEIVQYRIKAVVCHAGGSLTSGHYVTVKFRGEGDDDVVFCDDDTVATSEDYAKFRGFHDAKNWRDVCDRKGLSGYVYVMEKLD